MAETIANDLLTRFSALPAARPLLERLGGTEGVYLVGGAVRDLLLGAEPLDLDLVIDGDLEPVAALLGTPDRVHDRFETRTVSVDGFAYDLARARRESYAHPGALPTVAPAGIAEDLGRRDFAANAIALGLAGRSRGRLLEAPYGREDVESAAAAGSARPELPRRPDAAAAPGPLRGAPGLRRRGAHPRTGPGGGRGARP